MLNYWIALKALNFMRTYACLCVCEYVRTRVEPWATFWKNHKGKTKQRGERGEGREYHTMFNVTLQGSTRRKWDEKTPRNQIN